MPVFDGINIEIVGFYGIILNNINEVCLHYSKFPVISIGIVILA